jgi:hypothetical protein
MRGYARASLPAMRYRLTPHHHVAMIGDRAVVLDTLSDRYRLLKPPTSSALRTLDHPASDDPRLRRLIALGIIEPGFPTRDATELPHPLCSAVEAPTLGAERLDFLAVTTAIARASFSLKVRGFAATLERASRRMNRHRSGPDRLISLSQAYARQRLRLPLRQICLPDSLALHRILARRGLYASLVIGVRLDPFGAHCWVQAHDIILNDSCDMVSGFTPILVQ